MRPTLLLLFLAAPAFAQNADVQKELMQRQQQSDRFNQQLREVRPETPQALRPYERQKADDERRALDRPPVPPLNPAPKAEPILPSSDRIILEPPR